ncbi:MAG: hypothetical protein DRR19_14955 [Candidatus Parabeggiatoa sp. nov. 1]|nr:MAG: hypothetical protein DRR19_14955 [Gammaproteobacteria bacterium]HEC84546.1 hypothetical protein [Thioploca sp.]
MLLFIIKPKKNNPYHPLLALEEPEAHLHPHAQRHVFEQIKNIQGHNNY